MTFRGRYSGLVLAVGLVTTPRPLSAQTDPAAAEMLFGDAKQLMVEGKYAQACPKLAESQRLDPGIGTLLYLGDCYEKLGKTASAWATFKEALGAAGRAGDAQREKAAGDRASALESKLSHVAIVVADGAPPDLTVTRDRIAVGHALWGTAFPIDPGDHVIEAGAPRRKSWSRTVSVPSGGPTVQIEIPKLDPEGAPEPSKVGPVGAPASADTGAVAAPGNGVHIAGWIALGAGAVGVGVGTYLGIKSHSKRTEVDDLCPLDRCPESRRGEITGLESDANDLGRLSLVGFAVGGAALVAGVTLLVLPRTKTKETHAGITPYLEPESAGVRGRF